MTSFRACARHGLATVIVGAALLLQLMIPAGWMPTASAHGPAITLCTGTGAMAMPGMAHQAADHHAPGLFGALPVTPPALPAACPPPRQVLLPAALAPMTVQDRQRGLGHPPRPSTGPPPAA